MNLVSLLVLPAIIGLTDIKEVTPGNFTATPNGTSLAIAGVALVILIGAIAFSKRKKEAFGGERRAVRRRHRRRLTVELHRRRTVPRLRPGHRRVRATVRCGTVDAVPPRPWAAVAPSALRRWAAVVLARRR